MDLREYIERQPDVMMGKACLKGTRIPVHLILQKLGAGETKEDVLAAYPQLTRDHITAALYYGAHLASHDSERLL